MQSSCNWWNNWLWIFRIGSEVSTMWTSEWLAVVNHHRLLEFAVGMNSHEGIRGWIWKYCRRPCMVPTSFFRMKKKHSCCTNLVHHRSDVSSTDPCSLSHFHSHSTGFFRSSFPFHWIGRPSVATTFQISPSTSFLKWSQARPWLNFTANFIISN